MAGDGYQQTRAPTSPAVIPWLSRPLLTRGREARPVPSGGFTRLSYPRAQTDTQREQPGLRCLAPPGGRRQGQVDDRRDSRRPDSPTKQPSPATGQGGQSVGAPESYPALHPCRLAALPSSRQANLPQRGTSTGGRIELSSRSSRPPPKPIAAGGPPRSYLRDRGPAFKRRLPRSWRRPSRVVRP